MRKKEQKIKEDLFTIYYNSKLDRVRNPLGYIQKQEPRLGVFLASIIFNF